MSEQIIVEYRGRRYIWDGKRWFGEDDYAIPPQSVQSHLNRLAMERLADDDATVTDPSELARRARIARDAGQMDRAESLAKRACSLDPIDGEGLWHFDDDLTCKEHDTIQSYMKVITKSTGKTTDEHCHNRFTLRQPVAFYVGYLRGLIEIFSALETERFQHAPEWIEGFAFCLILRAGIAFDYLVTGRKLYDNPFGGYTLKDRRPRTSRSGRISIDRWDEDPNESVIFKYHGIYKQSHESGSEEAINHMKEQFTFDKPDAFYMGYTKGLLQTVLRFEEANFVFEPAELTAFHAGLVTRAAFLFDKL